MNKELKETIQNVFSLNYELIKENARPEMIGIYFARRDLAEQLLKVIKGIEHQELRENVGWGQYTTNWLDFFVEGNFNCINCNNQNPFKLDNVGIKEQTFTCAFCKTENTVYYEFVVKVKKKEDNSNE